MVICSSRHSLEAAPRTPTSVKCRGTSAGCVTHVGTHLANASPIALATDSILNPVQGVVTDL